MVADMALYGTVGGALLGTASMAYGNNSRAIFQGASLGLYAGLLFGAYVILTYDTGRSRSEDEEFLRMPSHQDFPEEGQGYPEDSHYRRRPVDSYEYRPSEKSRDDGGFEDEENFDGDDSASRVTHPGEKDLIAQGRQTLVYLPLVHLRF